MGLMVVEDLCIPGFTSDWFVGCDLASFWLCLIDESGLYLYRGFTSVFNAVFVCPQFLLRVMFTYSRLACTHSVNWYVHVVGMCENALNQNDRLSRTL